MSKETMEWLNTNTLIGFTGKRGNAWHYQADLQAVSNHFPGAVPIEVVRERLFNWRAVSRPLFMQVPASLETATGIDEQAEPVKLIPVVGRQAISRSDNDHLMGIFTDGYVIHQYDEWLLKSVANILDDDLAIGSAGLLKGGAVAWVSVEVSENIVTPEGVEFRPNLLACTSMDGSLATTYQRVVTNVVCDNTMSIALSEQGQRLKIKHSRGSSVKLGAARDALNIVHDIAEDFQAQVRDLTRVEVTDKQWAQFLDAYVPIDPESKRGSTLAENKRDALQTYWNRDAMSTQWKNTAWGVVQSVNTWAHHDAIVRNGSRDERNRQRAVSGKVNELDQGTLQTLNRVLVGA